MQLSDLIAASRARFGTAPDPATPAGAAAAARTEISGLASDSRAVRPGDLFAALPGIVAQGCDFIPEALRRGAVALLVPAGAHDGRDLTAHGVPVYEDPTPRRALARLAAVFFGPPLARVAAVTGTNGKSSVAEFSRQIQARLGMAAASLGTLGLVAPDRPRLEGLTTPDPIALHRLLAELRAQGIDHLTLEASSHGLDQQRLAGLPVAAAGFTNLSHEHLDYHGDMAGYLAAKMRLFSEVLAPGGVAVLNADSPHFSRLAKTAEARGARVLDYGERATALRVADWRPTATGQAVTLEVLGRRACLELPLIGRFQLDNALCALGLTLGVTLALAREAPPEFIDEALAALATLAPVRGRLEEVTAAAGPADGPRCFVDYAHSPDALARALEALDAHRTGRLILVFGCGGARDRAKRAEMGRIAAARADRVLVTDDNPRDEDPAAIRAEILAACPGGIDAGARGAAIRQAFAEAGPDDVILLAGKGHEQGQIVGTEIQPFDDAAEARRAARARAEDRRKTEEARQ